jgi:hypothetical protein
MSMRKRFVSFVAVACVAGAIGAAPASAASAPSFKIPSLGSLGGLCKTVKQGSLQAACNKGVSTIEGCSSETSTEGALACLSGAAGSLQTSRVKLPFDLKGLLAKFTSSSGGGFGGIKLPSLGGLSGIKLPGGLDLSALLAGLRG